METIPLGISGASEGRSEGYERHVMKGTHIIADEGSQGTREQLNGNICHQDRHVYTAAKVPNYLSA